MEVDYKSNGVHITARIPETDEGFAKISPFIEEMGGMKYCGGRDQFIDALKKLWELFEIVDVSNNINTIKMKATAIKHLLKLSLRKNYVDKHILVAGQRISYWGKEYIFHSLVKSNLTYHVKVPGHNQAVFIDPIYYWVMVERQEVTTKN